MASPKRWKCTISRSRRNANGVVHIRVVRNAEDIVIRHARFLLGCRSSVRSAMGSPVTAMVAALQGVPEAACG